MAEPGIHVSISHLCCRICSEVLRDPATVPCGHNFCMQCIEGRWGRGGRNGCPCSCPECGKVFPARPQLIKNTTLAELVRNTGSFNNGSGKRNLQEQQQQRSGEFPQVPKRVRSCAGGSGGTLCRRHNSPLEVYCCTDEEVICAICASAEHRGHRIGCVGEERRRKQEELRTMKMKSKQILRQQKKKQRNLVKILEQIQEEAREARDYCEGVVVGVMASLQKHYLSVRELIGAQEEEATTQIHTSIQALEAKMEEMRKRNADLDSLAQTQSDVGFLQEWPSLQSLCKDDRRRDHRDPEDPLLPFKFTKRAVEQLGRRLEGYCDREFASIAEAVDSEEHWESSGETEEEDVQRGREACGSHSHSDGTRTEPAASVEPTARAEFLQYACNLTLDCATAHEDLAVSEGNKMVKLMPQTQKNRAPRCPLSSERFIHRRQVLCKEGLQAERCYYEIEVEGDKVEIALAYRGIDRKSRTEQSAFGGNANSWSLDRSKNYSVSHKSGSVQLIASPSHRRIGVYLKFREGTLSFYEVSDSMKFLYRAEAKFTEPLYPGFWLGEKCCIRICDLRQDEL